MINRVSFLIFSLVLSLTISFSQAQTAHIDSLRQKAEQGDADAQFMLGYAYDFGKGVLQDHKEAVKWWQKAAEQGHADAQYWLGAAYENGEGVPQDYTEGVKWYRKAAEQGHADAQLMLGWVYADGDGVPKDSVLAYMWLNLAASKIKGEFRESAAKFRDRVAEKMTREQIAEAQRLAREWAEKHRK